jgi:hypothetical protein
MVPSTSRFRSALLLAACLGLAACAVGPQLTAHGPSAVDMTPQAITAAGTCSPLPHDSTPNVNATPGWQQVVPSIPDMQCGSKFGSGPFYCSGAAACPGDLIWGTHPRDPEQRGQTWHGIVDLLEGTIKACAEPANRFGWRTVDCELKEFTAAKDHPVRVVLPVKVPPLLSGVTKQDATTVQVHIKAGGSGPIVIGQMGFAEQAP